MKRGKGIGFYAGIIYFIIFILIPLPLRAEEDEKTLRFDVKGYLMSLFTFFRGDAENGDYTLTTHRLRLETRTFYKEKLSLNLTCNTEIFGGNLVSSPRWDYLQTGQAQAYWNLSTGSKTKINKQDIYLKHSIHRLYLNYEGDSYRWILGKQRIAWGVMRYWRPTDIFNPESPLQADPGERQGIDAVYFKPQWKNGRGVDLLYSPSRFQGIESYAGKFNFRVGEYDLSFIAGKVRGMPVTGITFDGYVGDGGFRGECLQVKNPGQKPYYQWSVGGDYSFPSNLSLTLEYLNNGGAKENNAVNPFIAGQGFLQTKRKQLVGLGTGYQLSPLLYLQIFTSYDMEGKSYALSPSLRWNYARNMDVSAGVSLFGGKKGGEYYQTPNLILTQMKLHF